MTGAVNGSVPFPGGNTGSPFFVVIPLEAAPTFFTPPQVTIDGTTVSWFYGALIGTARAVNCLIRFGVY